MRLSNISQSIAVKLLSLDERVRDLASQADKAEAALADARAVVNFKREVSKAEHAKVRAEFDAIHAHALQARQRADEMRGILQDGIHSWIAALPHNAKLHLMPPPAADSDLAALEIQLKDMRAELAKLRSIVVPSDDINECVRSYVRGIAAKAQPMLRGLGSGQELAILWPDGGDDCNLNNGSGFSAMGANALTMSALLMPDELANVIVRAAHATMPMPKAKLEKRLSELPDAIDALSYEVAYLRDKANLPPDPAMRPWHHLSVRLGKDESVTAAMANVVATAIRV